MATAEKELQNDMEPIARLSRDLRKAAKTLSAQEARFLVDSYYIVQEYRKRSDNQIRALTESGEPCEVLSWFTQNNRLLESQVKSALTVYAKHHPVGAVMMTIRGIGPVITAGLLAHIDITRAPTVGHIWSFAGLNPEQKWEKGQKRPWNAALKKLCWLVGESFVKVSNHEAAYYGHLYQKRKAQEQERNEQGMYEPVAEQILKEKNIGKSTEAYKHYIEGRLPPSQIHGRAKRYAVKRFLSDFHVILYWHQYQKLPPSPYAIAILGHAHEVLAPVFDEVPDLKRALLKASPKKQAK